MTIQLYVMVSLHLSTTNKTLEYAGRLRTLLKPLNQSLN